MLGCVRVDGQLGSLNDVQQPVDSRDLVLNLLLTQEILFLRPIG